MNEQSLPRYPIYIPSKGRADQCYSAEFLNADGIPFYLVVEAQEREDYARVFGATSLLILPFRDSGSVIPARNWINEHATASGHIRHWQIDDNIKYISRLYRGKRIRCHAGVALRVVEDFTDRYENVAIAGLNYDFFAVGKKTPFTLNAHIYSCMLILNSIPYHWRGKYNEDTDMCLQVLAHGWCTILVNAFLIKKMRTMTMKGGNTDELYHEDDGRLKMARALERKWPGVVETKRRWKRPQHVVHHQWRYFDTPLKFKSDIDLDDMRSDEYGMKLQKVREIRSERLQRLYQEANQ